MVGCGSLSRQVRDEGREAETDNCPFKNKCKLSHAQEREQSEARQREPAWKLQPCAVPQMRS